MAASIPAIVLGNQRKNEVANNKVAGLIDNPFVPPHDRESLFTGTPMRMLAAVALATAFLAATAYAGVHEWDRAAHLYDPALGPVRLTAVEPLADRSPTAHYVLGFYPYWGGALSLLRFDVLDEIVFFAADATSTGALSDLHGWPRHDLVNAAHAAGCRVTLAVELFSSTDMSTLLASATNRARLVKNAVQAVQDGAADGVNIDFEGLPVAQKANFVLLMQELAAALPGAALSVDTPAVDWAGAYDYNELAAVARLMIMAYDYHYPGGDPGPVSPLRGSTRWGEYAIDWTVNDYQTYMAPYHLTRAILGLPFYGYDWPTTDGSIPGTATGAATARFITAAWDLANQHGGGSWDAASTTPYLIYQSSGWRQLWYESLDSLSAKFNFAAQENLGGIGFWALTYDEGDAGIWKLVEAYKNGDDDDDNDDNDNDDDSADDDNDNDDASPDNSGSGGSPGCGC